MKVYLCGQMRGLPDLGHAAFRDGARRLREDGHEVFSPAEHDVANGLVPGGAAGFDLRRALAADLAWICAHADAVVMLPGWERSLGATAEVATARALSLPVLALDKLTGGEL